MAASSGTRKSSRLDCMGSDSEATAFPNLDKKRRSKATIANLAMWFPSATKLYFRTRELLISFEKFHACSLSGMAISKRTTDYVPMRDDQEYGS